MSPSIACLHTNVFNLIASNRITSAIQGDYAHIDVCPELPKLLACLNQLGEDILLIVNHIAKDPAASPSHCRKGYIVPISFSIFYWSREIFDRCLHAGPHGNMHAKRNSAIFHLRPEPFITRTVRTLRFLAGGGR